MHYAFTVLLALGLLGPENQVDAATTRVEFDQSHLQTLSVTALRQAAGQRGRPDPA